MLLPQQGRTILKTLFLMACTVGLVGCQTGKSRPLDTPRATIAVEQFSGTPVSGPLREPANPARPEDALAVNVTVVALNQLPGSALQPLSAHAQLIAVTQGTVPVQSSPVLTSGARFGVADEAMSFRQHLSSRSMSEALELQRVNRALPAGTTTVVAADESTHDPARRVAIEVSFPKESAAAPGVRLALLIEDQAVPPAPPPAEESDEPVPAAAPPRFQRETVVLDELKLDGRLQAAIIAPFQFTESGSKAIAFLVEVSPGANDPAHVQAFEHAKVELARSAGVAGKRPGVGPLQIDAFASLRAAIGRLSDPQARRAAMLYLANQTGAKICGDVALVAEDSLLQSLSDRITAKETSGDAGQTLDAFGWMLDRTTLELLTELSGSNKLAPELAAVLSIHAGEAGRSSSSLEQVSKGVKTRQDFENRLIAENLIFLEDNSPASRVRAFDWLRGIDRAPHDYDPMASPHDRQQALDRALTAATPSTQQAQP
jgi:hypothetical protein